MAEVWNISHLVCQTRTYLFPHYSQCLCEPDTRTFLSFSAPALCAGADFHSSGRAFRQISASLHATSKAAKPPTYIDYFLSQTMLVVVPCARVVHPGRRILLPMRHQAVNPSNEFYQPNRRTTMIKRATAAAIKWFFSSLFS